MANLKEVRVRITSVTSTQQITKAMGMVSAAKLRKAQDAIVQMRPFAKKLREVIENVSSSVDASAGGDLTVVRPVNKVLFVAVTSNRGLCGAFNSNIIKAVIRNANENFPKQLAEGNVKVMTIGKKASDYFAKLPNMFFERHDQVFADLRFENVSVIAEKIMSEFKAGNFDRVILVYNQFKNAAVQILQDNEAMLPLVPAATDIMPASSKKVVETTLAKKMNNDYIFEPNKEQMMIELMPKAIRVQLYKAVLDSNASEHGARMTAMNKATDNAGELLRELKLSYNKARQAAITNEILEIVGGAEALKG